MSQFKVSIVVRTYTEKRWHYLIKCLDSLISQSRQADQIVVVVDHNPPLLEKIQRDFPMVNAVENDLPQGSSGAWNSGILNATGEIVAFIDDDAIAETDWLVQLVSHYDNPQVFGVGGHIEPLWESGKPGWFPDEFLWVIGCSYKGLPETVAPIRNMIGCNMSFRRETFKWIGGFRDGMGHVGSNPIGCDETEICIRLRQQKPEISLLHDPGAIVHHHVPPQRTTWQYFLRRCALEGRSKAQVAYLVGQQQGLESERRYSSQILPQGILQNIQKWIRGERRGLSRAAAILAGFLTTALNYTLLSIWLRISGKKENNVAEIFADNS